MRPREGEETGGSTLDLRWPFGRVLLGSVALLTLTVGLAEMTVRLNWVRSRLPAPTLVGHQFVDVKLARLYSVNEEHGPLDCIVLGNSSVMAAIDPETLANEYRQRTGRSLECFNLGIPGLNLRSARLIGGLVSKLYRPSLLIVGLPVGRGLSLQTVLQSNPWLRYHFGNRNLKGWLIEHSQAYRHYLRFRIWLEHPAHSRRIQALEGRMSPLGYTNTGINAVMQNIDIPPDPRFRTPMAFLTDFERLLHLTAR